MSETRLPEQISSRIERGESFSFRCHCAVRCFTDCCRELELELTPYDVLRLRHATGLDSSELHRRYIIEEPCPDNGFPRFYLTMVDDGSASCVFVTKDGCSIYRDRPGACRTYPLGRGVSRSAAGVSEQFILLKEPHCKGFEESTAQTVESFMDSQELEPYNRFNDMLTEITQYVPAPGGAQLSDNHRRLYKLALFDIDLFRAGLRARHEKAPLGAMEQILDDDEALLEYGITFVRKVIFGASGNQVPTR